MTEPAYLPLGTVLGGRYAVVREIGRGGYSIVYLARDRELGSELAVKLLVPPPAVARLARERMRREVQLVRGLSHPNVVSVYDFVDDGAWSFIVMEYVAGSDLHLRVRDRGPLTADDAVRVGRDIAAALAVAHRRGILHRDVKPQNILLDPDGRARLTDFGSAKLDTQASVTQTGGLVGTLDYAAPEVIAGRRGDARSDGYGLGMTLYFALTGRLPERPSPHLPPSPAPGGYRPRAARADLPRWLDTVVARATAAEPGQRFPSAQALSDALAERVAQDEFGLERPPLRLEACVVCGAPDPFNVGVCPRCTGEPSPGDDALVFVERAISEPARHGVAERIAGLLGARVPTADHQSAARGERSLLRVPVAAAARVVETLEAQDIPARAVAPGRAWAAIPVGFYGLVGAVVVVGVAAGVAAAPYFVWASPLVAALLLSAAGRRVRTPLWGAEQARATPLPRDVVAEVVQAFAQLPPGAARSLLTELVRSGKACYEEERVHPEVGRAIGAACRVAVGLARLEVDLAAFEAERERLPAVPAARFDAMARCERARDALVQRLLDATTALGALRSQATELAASAAPELAELTRALEAEAQARAAAAREVAELLGDLKA